MDIIGELRKKRQYLILNNENLVVCYHYTVTMIIKNKRNKSF